MMIFKKEDVYNRIDEKLIKLYKIAGTIFWWISIISKNTI